MSDEPTRPGELPDDGAPAAVVGGGDEGAAEGVSHYYDQRLQAPKCGCDLAPGVDGRMSPADGKYVRRWSDVDCPACIEARSETSKNTEKAKAKAKPKRPRKPTANEPTEDQIRAAAITGLVGLLNFGLAMTRRPPAPPALAVPWAASAIRVSEHYGLDGVTDHPLTGFVASTAMLAAAVARSEPVPVPELGEDPLPELHAAAAEQLAGMLGT